MVVGSCRALVVVEGLLFVAARAAEPRVWFHGAQVIEPTCEALACMPNPAISAYAQHWLTAEGAALLARGVHPDIRKERQLRQDETRALGTQRYYTHAVEGDVATLKDAALAMTRTGFAVSIYGEATAEARRGIEEARRKLRAAQPTGGCRAEVPCRARRTRPAVDLVVKSALPKRHAHVFVLPPPRTKNLYHFICDSILPVAWAVARAPGCSNATLRCDPPAEVHVSLDGRRRLKGAVAWLELLDVLFEGRVHGLGETTGRVDRLTWGVGESIVYGDFGDRAVGLAAALHARLRDHYGTEEPVPRANKGGGGGGGGGGGPVVLYIARGRHGDGRFVPEEKRRLLLDAFREAGAAEVGVCCNWAATDARVMWATFSRADIVVGLHGAGCSNALFAAEGSVMVELHAAKGASTLTFRRIAAARRGGYVRAAMVGKGRDAGHDFVDAHQPAAIAACALAAWQGQSRETIERLCFNPTSFIEEAWAPQDMVLRAPPPRTYLDPETLVF